MGITDWNRPARAVHDWIRALTQPYPGAFTSWDGRKVMLWASAMPGPGRTGQPGQVLALDERGPLVGTADGSVRVTAMSDAGSPPEPARLWARRNGLRPGASFGAVDEATARWALGLGPDPAALPAGR
jgi:methionyl-tRNA formyltransferase